MRLGSKERALDPQVGPTLREAAPSDLPAINGIGQRRGTGTRLLAAAVAAARAQPVDGLLVKAQADAAPLFSSQGLVPLPVEDPDRDYPHRFWLAL